MPISADAGGSVVGNYVKLIQTPGDSTSLTLQVDVNGTQAGGFADVAVLDHYRQTSSDLVKVHFAASDHLITL